MEIKLDEKQENELTTYITGIVKSAVKSATKVQEKPFLNRKETAKYFGVADSTIRYWVSLGMPVVVIEGRKLYSKKSITEWLASHEVKAK